MANTTEHFASVEYFDGTTSIKTARIGKRELLRLHIEKGIQFLDPHVFRVRHNIGDIICMVSIDSEPRMDEIYERQLLVTRRCITDRKTVVFQEGTRFMVTLDAPDLLEPFVRFVGIPELLNPDAE